MKKGKSLRIAAVAAIAALAIAIVGCDAGPGSPPDTTVSVVNAQYCAFLDSNTAYVSAYDSTSAEGGVYTFSPAGTSTGGADRLYMTESSSGSVFTYDPETHAPSATSLASTRMNATGEIAFYRGIGYASVGSGTGAGVYYFDPAAEVPSFTKIASYRPISGTEGDSYQELIIAADGYLYAANNTDGTVVKIDTATDTIVSTINATAAGATGLFAGIYDGDAAVFVANTGGYDADWNPLPGSIDFISSNGTTAERVANELSGGDAIYPARLVQLSNGNLVATGYGHSYLVDLSGDDPIATELLHGGAAFGSLDIAYKDGLIFIPTSGYGMSANLLYVFDEDGSMQSYSPVTVMNSSDSISNIAFYED